MAERGEGQRRSKYVRLAAFLAGQPPERERLVLSLLEIEEVVGEHLPAGARFPSWWRNDGRRTHSRAWLLAGWRVGGLRHDATVEFVRGLEDAI